MCGGRCLQAELPPETLVSVVAVDGVVTLWPLAGAAAAPDGNGALPAAQHQNGGSGPPHEHHSGQAGGWGGGGGQPEAAGRMVAHTMLGDTPMDQVSLASGCHANCCTHR